MLATEYRVGRRAALGPTSSRLLFMCLAGRDNRPDGPTLCSSTLASGPTVEAFGEAEGHGAFAGIQRSPRQLLMKGRLGDFIAAVESTTWYVGAISRGEPSFYMEAAVY
jgi:hypothetical protein